ncbi:MAG TPA: acyl-CoA dehydrogenase family protein [Amycolatopsis sp.]|nr:acyl-CoA dehydrogenase family protein [Amycolatopsis sp.]
MKRSIFEPEHEQFRDLARTFFRRECAPYAEKWERQGHVDREVWRKAGAAGLLLWSAPPAYGGGGVVDFRFNAVLSEEYFAAGVTGFGIAVQNDIVGPYLLELASPEQQARWLPGSVSGDIVWAIAMSEPAAGSDLKAITTTAVADGDGFVLNGSKTFITNGLLADQVIVVAKTRPELGHKGVSLLVVPSSAPGFSVGRKLDKVGQRAQDTAELFFSDVRVPARDVLGEPEHGFYHLMRGLAQERLSIAVSGAAVMERAVALTIDYVRTRHAFGRPIGAFQNTRFELADMHSLTRAARAYVDQAIGAHRAGELTAEEAAGLKQWITDRQCELVDRCVQLFGGYGYMNEYEIARLWRDSRVQRIYAGSNEVMKEIVGRSLRLDEAPARRQSP